MTAKPQTQLDTDEARMKAFVKEFKALMRKHNAEFDEWEHRGLNEEICGSTTVIKIGSAFCDLPL